MRRPWFGGLLVGGRASGTGAFLACGLVVAAGCSRLAGAPPDASGSDAAPPSDLAVLARAEDQRRAADVPEALRSSHDVAVRRRAARAFSRIADGQSEEALLKLLADEDDETVAWAAYGLGRSCKGREEARVNALVARAAALEGGARTRGAADTAVGDARDRVDARTAIVRAVGRCGAPASEPVLAAWVRARGTWAEPATYALGDVAARRGSLTEDATRSLLDALEDDRPDVAPCYLHGALDGSSESGPLDAAIYPLGRVERVPEPLAARVIDAARAVLARPGVARIFAVRALGRTTKAAVADLVRVACDKAYGVAERAEAARALALLGADGQAGIGEVLARVVPDKDPLAIASLGADEFTPMSALVAAVGADPPKKAEPALEALAHIQAPGAVPEPLARRLEVLRCGAAAALARGAYDADVLAKCAPEQSEAWERARLTALARRPLVGERREAWRALSRSKNIRVREDALDAFAGHAELGETGRRALADALASKHAGLVATAASVVQAHPDRVMILAERERRAALDPSAPPPDRNPARDVDPKIAKALSAALAESWAEDLVETRANVLDAAAAVSLPGAREAARAACRDANTTIRERAAKARRAMGDAAAPAECTPPDTPPSTAPELDHLLAAAGRVVFQTDAGEVSIRFEPDLAPVTATRFVELARAGFFKGIVVHRVVPGFVVQLGDPGADGYGGAGKLLRDETSPVAFGALDVGVALAGRDTGSSQLFVTLARYPHLDGEYARIGRAEGDWAAIALGDVVRDVRVEP